MEDLPVSELSRPVPPQPHPYLAQMARFSDGELHVTRRAEVMAALPDPAGLEEAARRRTERGLPDRFDLVPLAFSVPVAVLGEALGVGDLGTDIAALSDGGAVGPSLPDVARTSILFQARLATAALVITAKLHGRPPEEVAPILRTRRAPDVAVSLAGAPYGAGAHECPGRLQALAIARGMLSPLDAYAVVEQGPTHVLPNTSFPSRLIVQRSAA